VVGWGVGSATLWTSLGGKQHSSGLLFTLIRYKISTTWRVQGQINHQSWPDLSLFIASVDRPHGESFALSINPGHNGLQKRQNDPRSTSGQGRRLPLSYGSQLPGSGLRSLIHKCAIFSPFYVSPGSLVDTTWSILEPGWLWVCSKALWSQWESFPLFHCVWGRPWMNIPQVRQFNHPFSSTQSRSHILLACIVWCYETRRLFDMIQR